MLRRLLEHAATRSSAPPCSSPRALPAATLASLAGQLGGGAVDVDPSPTRRSRAPASSPGPDGVVLATGSIYLIADLLRPPGARGGRSL